MRMSEHEPVFAAICQSPVVHPTLTRVGDDSLDVRARSEIIRLNLTLDNTSERIMPSPSFLLTPVAAP